MDHHPASSSEQLPEQLPFRINVDALPADALGYLSWQFAELTEYGAEGDKDLAAVEAVRDAFEEDMRRLGERDPDRVAAAYESIASHVDSDYRRYAPYCATRYAVVRPDKVYGFLEALVKDPDADVREAALSVVSSPFTSGGAWYDDTLANLGLTPREAGILFYKAYATEQNYQFAANRAVGSAGLATTVEQTRA